MGGKKTNQNRRIVLIRRFAWRSVMATPTLRACERHCSSPRLRAAGTEEGTRWRIIHQGQPYSDGGALWHRLMTAMPVEVRRGRARVRGVNLDAGIAKLCGKLDGQHVERRLGSRITKRFQLNMLTVQLAAELRDTGIKVNS